MKRTATAVENRDDFDTAGSCTEVNDIRKTFHPNTANVFVTGGVQFRELTNVVKHNIDGGQKFRAQSRLSAFIPIASFGQVRFGFRTDDERRCHCSPRNRARTSSQGRPADGFASAAANRRSSSSRWLCGMGSLSGAKLSQISPISWRRSSALSRSIPSSRMDADIDSSRKGCNRTTILIVTDGRRKR